MQQRVKQSSGLSQWLEQLASRVHRNVAVVCSGQQTGSHGLGGAR